MIEYCFLMQIRHHEARALLILGMASLEFLSLRNTGMELSIYEVAQLVDCLGPHPGIIWT